MPRGSNSNSRINPNWKTGAVKAEKSRLRKRLASLKKHIKSLELAVKQFDPEFDSQKWARAFDSDNPVDTNKVMLVTGSFSTIINNYVETIKAGSRLMGLYDNKRRAKEALEAVVADGALTGEQSKTVQRLYKMEGRIQHLSPDITATEVRAAVLELQHSLPALKNSLENWLHETLS